MPHPTFLRLAASLGAVALAHLGSARNDLPSFADVTVHDPSVVRDRDTFYIFGSHLASASTRDGLHWTQLSTAPEPGNPLFPDPAGHFAEAIAWVGGDNAFWAPDVIQLPDGRYAYYYCIGRLDQPRAVLGLATADAITGPYTDQGVMLRSGNWGEPSPDGTIYDPTRHPNAVDPDVFFDRDGRMWMVYGSYSGGIFILELDPASGWPLPGQGFGRKLMGGHHARIEGPFILYSPESHYYYLFVSYGGLAADGGYNVRVGRSRTPDGPYFDAAGQELTEVSGTPGTLFDDAAIEPYGAKLIGNYRFLPVDGEPVTRTQGYLSPGHNSAYYDARSGQYFLVFHTRFVGRGETHQVRVHPMYLTDDDWLVVAPHRHAGERAERLDRRDVAGDYKVIRHDKTISPEVRTSALITLRPNGRVEGAYSGTWSLNREDALTLTLGGEVYCGVAATQWDDDQGAWVRVFTALSSEGVSLWGSRPVIGRRPPRTETLPDRLALFGETRELALPEPRGHPRTPFTYSLLEGPAGATIDRATGLLTWNPTLTQVDVPYPVTVVAVAVSPDDPRQTRYSFTLTAHSINVVRRVDLSFDEPGTEGLTDALGQLTGLTARLPGTGSALPALDPRLLLDSEAGVLEVQSARADFFGQVGLENASAPGLSLAALGFTGSEDFSVSAEFRSVGPIAFIDQVGLYVGAHSNLLTRAGTIVFGAPERYSAHTSNGADFDARFFGFGLDVSDGMTVTIGREAGTWRYLIDDREWNPLSAPTFLDGRSDLVAGVFAITPLNDTTKTIELDRLSLVVATQEPQLTPLEAWRIRHFAVLEPEGIAADHADPDRDRVRNLTEFERGTDPLDPHSR